MDEGTFELGTLTPLPRILCSGDDEPLLRPSLVSAFHRCDGGSFHTAFDHVIHFLAVLGRESATGTGPCPRHGWLACSSGRRADFEREAADKGHLA